MALTVNRSLPLALVLVCLSVLGAGAALLPASPALSQDERRAPATLRDAWKEVEGRRATVQREGALLTVAVSLRDQIGPMVIESVGTDHVVLVADGSGPRWRSVVPFGMIELQVFR
jgi:hypothetical protein